MSGDVTHGTDPASTGTVVVTGAASGIGRVYASRLAARGRDLLLVDRQADLLDEAAQQLTASTAASVETLVADLSVEADIGRVVDRLANDEAITMLVNNAGTSKVAPLVDSTWPELQAMIEVNVTAVLRLSMAVLPRFTACNRGTLVNVGSAAGFYSYTGSVVYCGTKAFTMAFTRGIQQELAGTGVVVQLVAPSATVSGIWEVAGVKLSSLDPTMVMSTEDCVDAALRGLEMGEVMTVPALGDPSVLTHFETAGAALLEAATRAGTPGARYLDAGTDLRAN